MPPAPSRSSISKGPMRVPGRMSAISWSPSDGGGVTARGQADAASLGSSLIGADACGGWGLPDAHPVAAGLFGSVERAIRGFVQIVHCHQSARNAGHAEGAGDPETACAVFELVAGQTRAHTLGESPALLGLSFRAEDRELLPADAGEDLFTSHQGAGELDDLFQDQVAAEMAVLVVDE